MNEEVNEEVVNEIRRRGMASWAGCISCGRRAQKRGVSDGPLCARPAARRARALPARCPAAASSSRASRPTTSFTLNFKLNILNLLLV